MKKILVSLLSLFLIGRTAQADFRCPSTGKIVTEGMNAYEIESACGAPTAKIKLTTDSSLSAMPAAEEWTYDFGPREFIRKLRLEGGVLKSEILGKYGTAKKQNSRIIGAEPN